MPKTQADYAREMQQAQIASVADPQILAALQRIEKLLQRLIEITAAK